MSAQIDACAIPLPARTVPITARTGDRVMSFDPECYKLAEHFLPDAAIERQKSDLAQAIQDAIQDWLDVEDAP